jgi:hypothetical protein
MAVSTSRSSSSSCRVDLDEAQYGVYVVRVCLRRALDPVDGLPQTRGGGGGFTYKLDKKLGFDGAWHGNPPGS